MYVAMHVSFAINLEYVRCPSCGVSCRRPLPEMIKGMRREVYIICVISDTHRANSPIGCRVPFTGSRKQALTGHGKR